ncbi:hypothetical protein AGLY_006242 [Aphis glycines]|uniref:Uncharacterized protein n=1 Tax=Aphis glycines TaxID=307491 RepID=A0A6G0TRD8_APHGL|nr:hypothetical protein AGLY_006242 [Aphis glycines]
MPPSTVAINDQPESYIILLLGLPERDHVPPLLFAMMVPGDGVHFQHLRHLYETAEVYALAERHGQSLLTRVGRVCRSWSVCPIRNTDRGRIVSSCRIGECTLTSIFVEHFHRTLRTGPCAGKKYNSVIDGVMQMISEYDVIENIYYEACEEQITHVEHRFIVFVRHCLVHERVTALRVVDALSRSGLRYLGRQYWEPGRSGTGLFLESASECVIDVL